jgi:hypothetical protein
MLSLYMDHHVPSAITAGLRLRAVDVLTVAEDGSAMLEDEPLLDRATSLGACYSARTMTCWQSRTYGSKRAMISLAWFTRINSRYP